MSEFPPLPDSTIRELSWMPSVATAAQIKSMALEIQRLRSPAPGWEEAIEAAAKVADETAALEDKHDRYEAWRAAHDIAQTIRALGRAPQ